MNHVRRVPLATRQSRPPARGVAGGWPGLVSFSGGGWDGNNRRFAAFQSPPRARFCAVPDRVGGVLGVLAGGGGGVWETGGFWGLAWPPAESEVQPAPAGEDDVVETKEISLATHVQNRFREIRDSPVADGMMAGSSPPESVFDAPMGVSMPVRPP